MRDYSMTHCAFGQCSGMTLKISHNIIVPRLSAGENGVGTVVTRRTQYSSVPCAVAIKLTDRFAIDRGVTCPAGRLLCPRDPAILNGSGHFSQIAVAILTSHSEVIGHRTTQALGYGSRMAFIASCHAGDLFVDKAVFIMYAEGEISCAARARACQRW